MKFAVCCNYLSKNTSQKNGRVEPIMELSLGHSLKRYGTQLLLGLQTISTKLRGSHYKWYQSYASTRNVGLTRDDLYAHKRGRLWMTKEKSNPYEWFPF